MKIYTKTGDAGQTGLVGGTRVPKDSPRIHAIGDVDELNAQIGVCRVHTDRNELVAVQNALFRLGAELATPEGAKGRTSQVSSTDAEALEKSMDDLSENLPPMRHFILPGGSLAAAHLHVARAVCRRAERSVLELSRIQTVRSEALVFLNRLSDWLFVAARTVNAEIGVEDIVWNEAEEK